MKSQDNQTDTPGIKQHKQCWQTAVMRDQIKNLRVSDKKLGDSLDEMNVVETTKIDHDLAHQFFPDIKLIGWGLHREKRNAWGGFYYRILKPKDPNRERERCIQWLYVWTSQSLFLLGLIMVCFILVALGILFAGSSPPIIKTIGTIIVSGFCLFLGGLRLIDMLKKRRDKQAEFYYHESMLLIPIGFGFLDLLCDPMVVWKPIELFEKSWVVPRISIILLIAGILLTFYLFKFQKMHDMDWAPLFLYLKQNSSDKWNLEKIIYDSFHYYTTKVSKDNLKFLDTAKKRVKLVVPNSWHSIATYKTRFHWKWHIMGIVSFFIFTPLLTLSILDDTPSPYFERPIVKLILLLMLLTVMLALYFKIGKSSEELIIYEIHNKKVFVKVETVNNYSQDNQQMKTESLSDDLFHLTPDKLAEFWTLKREAALQIRSKLKNPFIDDADFETFRDDPLMILYSEILPKIRQQDEQLTEILPKIRQQDEQLKQLDKRLKKLE